MFSMIDFIYLCENCVWCYSERCTAKTRNSKQYFWCVGCESCCRPQLGHIFMHNEQFFALVVSWSRYTVGRGSSLCYQRWASYIRLAMWSIYYHAGTTFESVWLTVCLFICLYVCLWVQTLWVPCRFVLYLLSSPMQTLRKKIRFFNGTNLTKFRQN